MSPIRCSCLPLAPAAKIWVDFGSGGGFPGIPIACALADQPAPWSISLKAMAKRLHFCARRCRTLKLPAQSP